MSDGRKAHWEQVYETKGEREVSWFEERPTLSLDMIARAGATADAAIIDIGGGASRLVDTLLDEGLSDITVLDLSAAALAAAKARLGPRGRSVAWIAADVTQWQPARQYDVWHDRAALHFLIEPADRAAYIETLRRALKPGGHAVIATFAPEGPERCSGLLVQRYDAQSLGRLLGREFELLETGRDVHRTPRDVAQAFQFSLFRRKR